MSTTVVIPAFGRLQPLRNAIASVLAQTMPVDEVLVVDDGSADPLASGLADLDDRLRVIRHDTNRGAAQARNTGVADATSDWIAFLDSDDEWMPDKHQRQMTALEQSGAVSGVTGYLLRRDSRDRVVAPTEDVVSFRRILRGCHVSPGSTWMVRRDHFVSLGGFDTELGRLEDWDLLLRAAQIAPIALLSDPVVLVHGHEGPAAEPVRRALDVIGSRWLPQLEPGARRLLRGGLHMEQAALHSRAGGRGRAMASIAAAVLNDPWQALDLSRRLTQRVRARRLA